MKFKAREWTCRVENDHVIIEVNFDANDIAAARAVADAKVRFINVHNPGGIRRSPEVIHKRIIAGKLADAAVGALIQRRIEKSGLTGLITIEEYDQKRQDDFQHPDPYDLALYREGKAEPESIEVRSSFCYRLAPLEKMVKKLSIYGWYTSANKPKEPKRDWYWQVIYYLRPQDIPQNDGPNVGIFEQELNQGMLTGYIVGGASRELLEKRGTDLTDHADGASYHAISPICGGYDYWGMVEAMLGTKNP